MQVKYLTLPKSGDPSYFQIVPKVGKTVLPTERCLPIQPLLLKWDPFCVIVKTNCHLCRLRSVIIILANAVYICQIVVKIYIHYTSIWVMKKYKPRSTENNAMGKAFLFWLTLPPAGWWMHWRRVYSN